MPEIKNISDDIKTIKQELAITKTSLTKAQSEIIDLKAEVKSLSDELETVKQTSNNNLKYLINHDRNVRSENVLIFGVPESAPIDADEGIVANSDQEKVAFIFRFIGVENSTIKTFFRLGKPGDKPRPIKVTLFSNTYAKNVLSKCATLKSYKNHTIYIKNDKSKGEQKEFTRIGKRKFELLQQNPTAPGQEPRVKLEKGVLMLDGVAVDRYEPVQSLF